MATSACCRARPWAIPGTTADIAVHPGGILSVGVLASSEPLRFAGAATTVRAWDGGDVEVTAGPAARPGEQVTGVYLIECGDLGEAVEVATQIPAAWYGSIEIRPVLAGPG